jgi:hypothetical protein
MRDGSMTLESRLYERAELRSPPTPLGDEQSGRKAGVRAKARVSSLSLSHMCIVSIPAATRKDLTADLRQGVCPPRARQRGGELRSSRRMASAFLLCIRVVPPLKAVMLR